MQTDPTTKQRIVLVTGPSGAGRSTAINALEDQGFEVIDNLPLSLLDTLFAGPAIGRPLALGLDVRNRDFGVDALIDTIDRLTTAETVDLQVLYIDCPEDELVRRYSETRRRHPLAPQEPPLIGIQRERELLIPIRARADILIDTGGQTPHDLRAEIDTCFAPQGSGLMGISVHSFSYKRGLPRGLDIVMDCRFLRNPHWDAGLRPLNGLDPAVDAHVAADPLFQAFFDGLLAQILLLLPAFKSEGKSHLAIGLGCTGGQHRSVAVTERLAKALAAEGWQVSKRHRELERHIGTGATAQRRPEA